MASIDAVTVWADDRPGRVKSIAEPRLCLGPRPAPSPLLVSCAGRDAAGDALIADLRARGLPTRGVVRCAAGATAAVSIMFGRSGEVGCRSPTHAMGHPAFQKSVAMSAKPLRLNEGAPAATPTGTKVGTKVGTMVWCAGGTRRNLGFRV